MDECLAVLFREKWAAFFQLIRLDYSLFSGSGILLSGIISGDLHGVQSDFVFAFLVVFFTAIAAFALNDYYDLAIDIRNRRYDRPLVLSLLSPRTALLTAFCALIVVIGLSLFMNQLALGLIVVSLPVFILYNVGLKKLLFVKNLIIAFAFVATILLGAVVSDGVLEPLSLYFASMGFIVGFAFEVMIDISDVPGDTASGVQTVASRFGAKVAALVSILLYAVIMVLDPLPFFVMIDSRLYWDYGFFLFIMIPVISYLRASIVLWRDQSPDNIVQLKRQLFVTMQIGSLAYVVGVIV